MLGPLSPQAVIDMIGLASDSLVKLVDGVKHLLVTGREEIDVTRARRTRKRLLDFSARARELYIGQQLRVASRLREYLEKDAPTAADWEAVLEGIDEVIYVLADLLDVIRKERSELVLDEAYEALTYGLAARRSILQDLRDMDPSSDQDLEAILQLSEEYRGMLGNMDDAINQLNAFLKNEG